MDEGNDLRVFVGVIQLSVVDRLKDVVDQKRDDVLHDIVPRSSIRNCIKIEFYFTFSIMSEEFQLSLFLHVIQL